MIAVRMVQPAVHEVIDMVTMRHRFVPAVWTMHVRARYVRRARHGICGTDRDDVFVHVFFVHVVEMAIVKIVHMAVMEDRSVPAVRTMLVRVIGVMRLGAGRHDFILSAFRNVVPWSLLTLEHAFSCFTRRRT